MIKTITNGDGDGDEAKQQQSKREGEGGETKGKTSHLSISSSSNKRQSHQRHHPFDITHSLRPPRLSYTQSTASTLSNPTDHHHQRRYRHHHHPTLDFYSSLSRFPSRPPTFVPPRSLIPPHTSSRTQPRVPFPENTPGESVPSGESWGNSPLTGFFLS